MVGSIGEANLRNLRIKKAFLSCTGFSLELGMTHHDLQDAHIKRQMIASTEQVIALVDASKFGKTDLTPFASLENITHLITDEDPGALHFSMHYIAPEQPLRSAGKRPSRPWHPSVTRTCSTESGLPTWAKTEANLRWP